MRSVCDPFAAVAMQRKLGPLLCSTPRRRGFTLLEVLVVVGIIATLIGLLVPVLSRAKDQARGVSCTSNLKQLMTGMMGYVAEQRTLPGTHGLFWMQILFGKEWPRPAGVTWDGARDRIVGLSVTPAYQQPYHQDPEFLADVPGKGTLFRYMKQESAYVCPSEKPGPADDTAAGGGGNGRLSYSLNAYVGYKAPEQLQSFTYVADSLNNALPGGLEKVSFKARQRVGFAPARYAAMFEDHPAFHTNATFPDGSFNCMDAVATRHSLIQKGAVSEGRSSMAFLDGHAEARMYPAKTLGRQIFAEFGAPSFWRDSGLPDKTNMAAFIKRLPGPCPWR